MDCGSNGGIAGGDVPILHMHPNLKVNFEGIIRHQLMDIPLATVGGIVTTSVGPAIVILPFYAYTGKDA